MLDLTHTGCHLFWANFQDPMVYRVIVKMESAELWTLDNEHDSNLELAIRDFAKRIEKPGKVQINDFENIIVILASIKISRTLRILQALDNSSPGLANKILTKAEELKNTHKCSKILIARNVIFERFRLLPKIFSKDRLEEINKALEGDG